MTIILLLFHFGCRNEALSTMGGQEADLLLSTDKSFRKSILLKLGNYLIDFSSFNLAMKSDGFVTCFCLSIGVILSRSY